MNSEGPDRSGVTAHGDVVCVRNIFKSFGGVPVLKGVSFNLQDKEILGVIGPSGGGKSTLLKCLNLLEPLDQGMVEYDGLFGPISSGKVTVRASGTHGGADHLSEETVNEVRRKIGLVFQGFNLWEEKTVRRNLVLAPTAVLHLSRGAADEKALRLCSQFGLEDKINTAVWKLSGGQKQRVAIIRSLMMDPEVLLLDEVTSALDPVLTFEVMEAIKKLRDDGLTMIIVTHHLEFASSICDRIMFLAEGRVVQMDTPQNLRTSPFSDEVGRFLAILQAAR